MAIANFIPTIWSALLLQSLEKNFVYGNLVNHDYEGEITGQGSSVKINQIGDITVKDFTDGTPITVQDVDGSQQVLNIDQAKYFAFRVSDISAAQANVDLMTSAMTNASYQLKDVIDSYIASLYVGVDAGNTIGDDTTPIVPTKDTAYEQLVDLASVLDDANVPSAGRWVVVPNWYYGLLLKDTRFVNSVGVNPALANGEIGMVDGLTVFKSNNVPNTSGAKYKIIAGYNGAISFAQQINSIEAYRPEDSFSDAVKGLSVFGAKLLRPKGIAVLTASKS